MFVLFQDTNPPAIVFANKFVLISLVTVCTPLLKVYQIRVDRIQILYESYGLIEELNIPTLPRKLKPKILSFDISPRKTPSSAFKPLDTPPKRPVRCTTEPLKF